MKKLLGGALTLFICSMALSQNVGIGETIPGAKLAIRTNNISENQLLVRNHENDSSLFIGYRSVYINGATNKIASLVIGNKSFLPADAPQLSLVARGEMAGGFLNGSTASLDFSNVNSERRFALSAYLGNVDSRGFSIIHSNGLLSKTLFYLNEAGLAGLSTYQPTARLQINHRASSLSPTLSLVDSNSTGGGSNILFSSVSNSATWQLRSALSTNPNNHFLDIISNGNIIASFGHGNNLGIGNALPIEKLDVDGNIRVTGEVNRTVTGGSNLVPIAYGNISSGGLLQSGSGNFTVSRLTTGFYIVTITGESYHFQSYTALITPVSSSNPIIVCTGSGSGNLHVFTYNAAGVATDSQFCFLVYKQ